MSSNLKEKARRLKGELEDMALPAARKAFDVLEIAASFTPVPGLDLVFKTLSCIVEMTEDARANKETREAFLSSVQSLLSALESANGEAKTLVRRASVGDDEKQKKAMDEIKHSRELQGAIEGLRSSIEDVEKDAVSLKHRRGVRGAIGSVIYASQDEDALQKMRKKLEDAIHRFQTSSALAIDKGLQVIQRLLKEAEDERVIDKLTRADAGYRAVDYLKSGFMDGTRNKLFDEIRTWATGQLPPDAPKRFYALFGRAGMGKSAVAHRLCRHLSEGDFLPSDSSLVLGASFFFVRDSGDKASALLLPPTIAWQLSGCKSHPILRTLIADAARSYIVHGTQQQLDHAFCGLLEPLSAASASLAPNHRVFLVIDGLDECSDQRLITEALTHLFTLVRTLPWLYIFAASRPEPHIMGAFSSSAATAIVHTQDLGEPSDSREDVEIYIRNMLLTAPLSPYSKLLISERSDTDLLQHLLDRAGGLFIFARIACNFLLENQDAPDSALQLILSPIEGGPLRSLDSLYLQILHFAFPPSTLDMFPDKHAHLLASLHILLLCNDPLALPILQPGSLALLGHQLCQTTLIRNRLPAKAANTHISLTKKNIESIIHSLRSVLSTDEDGRVAPLHATLGEFLLDPTRCTDPLYQVNEGEGHAGLASACLGVASSLRATTDILATFRDKDVDLRTYQYAIWYLGDHAGSAMWTKSLDNSLTQLVSTLQLSLMARLVMIVPGTSGAVRDHYQGLQSFCKKSTNGASTGSESKGASEASLAEEYLKFMAYCLCLMDHVRSHPGEDWPDISGETVQKYFVKLLRDGLRGRSIVQVAEGWAADQIEVGRYRSVVLALKAEIDQDERARSLWYDFSIEY
ncbi:hypothetical protein PsYK624_131230 [Phanerochaete sordida]|uniref:Nephrocystin 3-like N-terminal domain-containing protein n=1 Tax=Phanerochaete sordida TaxID=48140 RepID=A0A9P3GP00_9APHY|nr:hypothetical protein PsYK624_131230 [Phanerochaete sordida]